MPDDSDDLSILNFIQDLADGDEIDFPEEIEMYSEIDVNALYEVNAHFTATDALDLGSEIKRLQVRTLHGAPQMDPTLRGGPEKPTIGELLDGILHLEIRLSGTGVNSHLADQIERRRKDLADKYDSVDDQVRINDVANLTEYLEEWNSALRETLDSRIEFPLTETSHLNIEHLLEVPKEFFEPGVWEWLDDPAQNDFEDACRAMAVGLSTASVMLSLRAVEYCLREWYEYDTGRDIGQRTWGQVIGELEDYYDNQEERPPVLSNLDYLKTKRNDVSHADSSPSQKEAERMLFRIEGTISEIYRQIS